MLGAFRTPAACSHLLQFEMKALGRGEGRPCRLGAEQAERAVTGGAEGTAVG